MYLIVVPLIFIIYWLIEKYEYYIADKKIKAYREKWGVKSENSEIQRNTTSDKSS